MENYHFGLFRRAGLFCAGALLTLGLCIGQAQAAFLSWSGPANNRVEVGQTFEVALKFEGLGWGAGDSIAAFDLNILYDSSIFKFVGGSFGASGFNALDLGDPSSILSFWSEIIESAGTVNMSAASGDDPLFLDTHQPDSFIGFTLSFMALSEDPAALIELGYPTQVVGTNLEEMGVSTPSPLSLTVTAGSPSGVPEPGMLSLFGIGMLGMWVGRRKKTAMK